MGRCESIAGRRGARRLALVFEGVVLRVVAERRAQRGGAALVDRGVLLDGLLGVCRGSNATRIHARRTSTRHMKSLTATERDARNVGMNQNGSDGGGGESAPR